jgi:hypothetical protein
MLGKIYIGVITLIILLSIYLFFVTECMVSLVYIVLIITQLFSLMNMYLIIVGIDNAMSLTAEMRKYRKDRTYQDEIMMSITSLILSIGIASYFCTS